MPELSIVVPVFNEAPNLRALDGELRAVLATLGRSAEIIYVDDCSRDDSVAVLQAIVVDQADQAVRTRLVQLRRNYGQTAAMAAGFQLSEGAVVVPLDADGQNNPADIPRLLDVYAQGFDVVSGWRRRRQDNRVARTLPSQVANWLIGRVSGVRLHDYGCTLKAYRGELLRELPLYGEMHRFIPLYLAQIGARVTELEVDHRPRTAGVSKYGGRRIFKVALDLFLLRFMTRYSARPMHFFGQAALVFFVGMIAVASAMVAFKYGWLRLVGIDYQASFVATPLPALAATFFLGAVISVFFGIQGEILVRVYHESQGRLPYAIRQVIDSHGSADNHLAESTHVRNSGDLGTARSRPR